MVEWIDEDTKLALNHVDGETYSSFYQLQHENHVMKMVLQ